MNDRTPIRVAIGISSGCEEGDCWKCDETKPVGGVLLVCVCSCHEPEGME